MRGKYMQCVNDALCQKQIAGFSANTFGLFTFSISNKYTPSLKIDLPAENFTDQPACS